MATYNGEKYIHEQMESILRQLGENDEVVVSDDSSTDNTIRIIESFGDKRIIILREQRFRSALFNFENALKHSHGKYIFLADQDDFWVHDRVSKILPYFDTYDLIVNDCKIVDDKLQVTGESYFNMVKAGPGLLRNLARTSSYIGCCMCFKREVLEKSLPFPKNIPMHDFWIAMIAEVLFRIKFIPEPLVLYRRHSNNLSFTATGSSNSLLKRASFRINTVIPLVARLLRNR